MEEKPRMTGCRYPGPKIAFRGFFEVGSASYHILHVILCQKTKLRVYKLHSLIARTKKQTGCRYPNLKVAFRGIFEVGSAKWGLQSGVCISSYSASQTVYFYQISCLYHKVYNSSYSRGHSVCKKVAFSFECRSISTAI